MIERLSLRIPVENPAIDIEALLGCSQIVQANSGTQSHMRPRFFKIISSSLHINKATNFGVITVVKYATDKIMDWNLQRVKITKNEINTVDRCLTKHVGNKRISVRNPLPLKSTRDDEILRVNWWQTVSADTATVGVQQHTDRTCKRPGFWNLNRI